MKKENARIVKPKSKSKTARPRLTDNAKFLCAFWMVEGDIAEIVTILFLQRTRTSDELWMIGELADDIDQPESWVKKIATGEIPPSKIKFTHPSGRVRMVRRKDTEQTAASELLEYFIDQQRNFRSIENFIAAGLLTRKDFANARVKNKRRVKENTKNAVESEIIVAARELGLGPQPNGDHPDHWIARCPETNHFIYITASANEFGCGYCGRKGGVDELRAFTNARRQKQKIVNRS